MVKKLTNSVILILFLAALIMYDWPAELAAILSTVALIVFAVAAGVVISNLIGGVTRGNQK